MHAKSDFDRIGGEPGLRAIIEEFIRRITTDIMIGFFFRRVDHARLERMEYEHAAAHLGGPVEYSGRPMKQAHRAHHIMGGHFERRKKILSDVLIAHGAPDDVRERWMAHLESLRAEVTHHAGSECS